MGFRASGLGCRRAKRSKSLSSPQKHLGRLMKVFGFLLGLRRVMLRNIVQRAAGLGFSRVLGFRV